MPWSSFSRATERRRLRPPERNASLPAADFAHLNAVPQLRSAHRPGERRDQTVELDEAVAFHAHEDVAVLFRGSAGGEVPRPELQILERCVEVVAGSDSG